MGWFTKRGRLEQQQEFLAQARRALDALSVTTATATHEHGVSVQLQSWAWKTLPLEYRNPARRHLETLVFYVYDPAAAELAGKMETLAELQEALAFIQAALTDPASITSETIRRQQALRAYAVEDLAGKRSRLRHLVNGLRDKDNPLMNRWESLLHDRALEDATEALPWFKTQDELDDAVRVRGTLSKETFPRVLLVDLRSLADELRSLKPSSTPEG